MKTLNTKEFKKLEVFKEFEVIADTEKALFLACDRADTEHFKDFDNVAIYFSDDSVVTDTIILIDKHYKKNNTF